MAVSAIVGAMVVGTGYSSYSGERAAGQQKQALRKQAGAHSLKRTRAERPPRYVLEDNPALFFLNELELPKPVKNTVMHIDRRHRNETAVSRDDDFLAPSGYPLEHRKMTAAGRTAFPAAHRSVHRTVADQRRAHVVEPGAHQFTFLPDADFAIMIV